MPGHSLDPLQLRILAVLGGAESPWVLTGGAALVARFGHRATRDLDLFVRESEEIGTVAVGQEHRLRGAGLEVTALQTSPSFKRLRITDGHLVTIVDFVAEPAPPLDQPTVTSIGGTDIRVDTGREILVSKLCALLGRREPRDLYDVMTLVGAGESLERAISEAPGKDGGFSPLLLAWNLRSFDLAAWADAERLDPETRRALEQFRDELVDILTS